MNEPDYTPTPSVKAFEPILGPKPDADDIAEQEYLEGHGGVEPEPTVDESKDPPIRIITFEEYELYDDWTHSTLTYYMGDCVLTDEYDEPMDYNRYLGDLDICDIFESTGVDSLYVRNATRNYTFEIIRENGSFGDIVLGGHFLSDEGGE